MNILLFISLLIIFFIFVIGVFALIFQRENDNQKYTEIELEEWNCPECGFTVQAGIECTYCYTKKPE